jgi:thiol-disulfide isomerase/thioredoxin
MISHWKKFLMMTSLVWAGTSRAQTRDTVQRNGITLIWINDERHLDPAEKNRMTEVFFKVYPEEMRAYNPSSAKTVVFFVDSTYDGVAETSGTRVRYNPYWFIKNPADLDVVTHEVMHIVQSYGGFNGPGWLTEGIADYARYRFGVYNAQAGWGLPDYAPDQSYTEAYRVTARFLVWVEEQKNPSAVKVLDAALRKETYSPGLWKTLTGVTVDELWAEYAAHPALKDTGYAAFWLSGRIGQYNSPATIYFDYMDGQQSHSDSAILQDGVFGFTGRVSGPAMVRMAFAPLGDGKEKAIYTGDARYFFISNERINILSKDSLSDARIMGSKTYEEYAAFNAFIGGSMMDLTKQANADFNQGSMMDKADTNFRNRVDSLFHFRVGQRRNRLLAYARSHPASFFSLVALSELTAKHEDLDSTLPVYNGLDTSLKETFLGIELHQRMASLGAIVVGAMAPVFSEPDMQGKAVSLSSYRGKYVLVDFWASWCEPCRAENPNVLKAYQQYKDKGFDVLSVSLDDKQDRWAAAVKQDGLPWKQVSDLKGWGNDAATLYAIRAIPSNLLIDPQGKIVAMNLRGDALEAALAKLLQ